MLKKKVTKKGVQRTKKQTKGGTIREKIYYI